MQNEVFRSLALHNSLMLAILCAWPATLLKVPPIKEGLCENEEESGAFAEVICKQMSFYPDSFSFDPYAK